MNVREPVAETIGNDAVHTATGRGWEAWYTLLDGVNANTLPHKALATLLVNEYGVSGWWAQSIAGSYERARGIRQRHEMTDG
jgi:hypothetical protein